MKLENETAMPAHLECAKHKFSMLALLTKNCAFFLGIVIWNYLFSIL